MSLRTGVLMDLFVICLSATLLWCLFALVFFLPTPIQFLEMLGYGALLTLIFFILAGLSYKYDFDKAQQREDRRQGYLRRMEEVNRRLAQNK